MRQFFMENPGFLLYKISVKSIIESLPKSITPLDFKYFMRCSLHGLLSPDGVFFRPSHTWQQKWSLTRSRAKLVRSHQVDGESWQRLITMNNGWLTGSLYKELFRLRHTLNIFSLSERELQSRPGRLTQTDA